MPHHAGMPPTAHRDSRQPITTVVVVTWRGRAQITDCLDALAAQERPHAVLVVDNASDDGTSALLANHPSRPKVLRLAGNTGYAGGIAAALSVVDTPFVAWLNDDAAPGADWLTALEDAMLPGVGAVASRLEYPDGTPQSQGVRLTPDGYGADRTASGIAFGFCGGAALLRTEPLHAVGGVPAEFFCYYEDTDTAWRLRLAGWQIVVADHAVVRHRHGVSTRPGSVRFHRWNERNRLLMLLRCAPIGVAMWELVRFAAITGLLPVRGLLYRLGLRNQGMDVSTAPNFRIGLRCRVLVEVITRLHPVLRQRSRIGNSAVASRGEIWQAWAGQ